MVMKNTITLIKDHMTGDLDYMIIYLQFTNWGGRGPILMITTDTFWQESVGQDVVKRSYLHLSPCCPFSRFVLSEAARTSGHQNTRTAEQDTSPSTASKV